MGAVDPYKGYSKVMASMPDRWKAVTTHNTNYIEGDADNHAVAICLRATGAGDIRWIDRHGTTVTMAFADNEIVPCSAVRVLTTGTTATGIYAGFVGGAVA